MLVASIKSGDTTKIENACSKAVIIFVLWLSLDFVVFFLPNDIADTYLEYSLVISILFIIGLIAYLKRKKEVRSYQPPNPQNLGQIQVTDSEMIINFQIQRL